MLLLFLPFLGFFLIFCITGWRPVIMLLLLLTKLLNQLVRCTLLCFRFVILFAFCSFIGRRLLLYRCSSPGYWFSIWSTVFFWLSVFIHVPTNCTYSLPVYFRSWEPKVEGLGSSGGGIPFSVCCVRLYCNGFNPFPLSVDVYARVIFGGGFFLFGICYPSSECYPCPSLMSCMLCDW